MLSYPPSFEYGTSTRMDLQPGLAMLALRASVSGDLSTALEAVDVEVLRSFAFPRGRPPRPINDMGRQRWVVDLLGRPVGALEEELVQLSGFGANLDYVAPVYRSSDARGLQGLFSVAPRLLVVRPARASQLVQAILDLGLPIQPERDVLVPLWSLGLQVFTVTGNDRSAIELRREILEQHGNVATAVHLKLVPMFKPSAYVPPKDPHGYYDASWHLPKIHAEEAWDIEPGGSHDLWIAVVDDGFELAHPDLAVNFQDPGIDVGAAPGTSAARLFVDEDHGTRVAGVAGAVLDNGVGVVGLAGASGLYPVKNNFSGLELAAAISAAANYTADDGSTPVRVLNLSVGLVIPTDITPYEVTLVDAALEHAAGTGLLICAGTGNGDTGADPAVPLYPAAHPAVMACGASDKDDTRAVRLFWESQYGTTTHLGTKTGISVVAPGVGIWLPTPEGAPPYGLDLGTSFATPLVSALGALLMKHYGITHEHTREVIERTAVKVKGPSSAPYVFEENPDFPHGTWNEEVGYGRIDALRALDWADVYIADWPGDQGLEPSAAPSGAFWANPDIVVRPVDDDAFDPTDTSASEIRLGADSWIYVRVHNRGPAEARNVHVRVRVIPEVSMSVLYPGDWINVDDSHLEPTEIHADFATLAAGASEVAKFKLDAGDLDAVVSAAGGGGGSLVEATILAEVTADNDYAWHTASTSGDNLSGRRNNLAQRSCAVLEAEPGDTLVVEPVFSGSFGPLFDWRILAMLERLPPIWPCWLEVETRRGRGRFDVGAGASSLGLTFGRRGGEGPDGEPLLAWPLDEARFGTLRPGRSKARLGIRIPAEAETGVHSVTLALERGGRTVGGVTVLLKVRERVG